MVKMELHTLSGRTARVRERSFPSVSPRGAPDTGSEATGSRRAASHSSTPGASTRVISRRRTRDSTVRRRDAIALDLAWRRCRQRVGRALQWKLRRRDMQAAVAGAARFWMSCSLVGCSGRQTHRPRAIRPRRAGRCIRRQARAGPLRTPAAGHSRFHGSCGQTDPRRETRATAWSAATRCSRQPRRA